MSVIEKVLGDFSDKKEWRQIEVRSKQLPPEYVSAYKSMKKYIENTGDVMTWEDSKRVLEGVLDVLEAAAAEGKKVKEVTGDDVAGFLDDLVEGSKGWKDKFREKLNNSIED